MTAPFDLKYKVSPTETSAWKWLLPLPIIAVVDVLEMFIRPIGSSI